MSIEAPKTEQDKGEEILIYRGVEENEEMGRVGKWWTTNPYYAFKYARGGKGRMFVSKIQKGYLTEMASDVSLEGEYENYLFKNQDPPNTREVTPEEIESLKSQTKFHKTEAPGGTIMEWPENAIEIGKNIFQNP